MPLTNKDIADCLDLILSEKNEKLWGKYREWLMKMKEDSES
ncbi:hypothetical protein LCGC14_2193810 [marine sediment metagenome]|uniref:Uncharacterized protein n=1 Tax=marine sediment metagenome TaxID=412755 RepID=A0A0F9E5T3_9ZZZZ